MFHTKANRLRRRVRLSLIVLATFFAHPVIAEEGISFQDGLDAYQKGNYPESLRIWQSLAGEGEPISAHSAGVLYANALGVEQDHAKAFTFYLQSAEAGYAPAQYDIGRSYFNGEGVDINHAEAAKWWAAAAEQKNVRALFNLATLYRKGLGVPKDEVLAREYYKMAADLGDNRASKILAAEHSRTNTRKSEVADLASGGVKRESWIMQQPSKHYTVQASAFSSESGAIGFAKKYELDDEIAIFRAHVGDKIWYKAIYKSFEKRSEALQARDELKQRFPSQRPWLRRFADIQQEINAKQTPGPGEYAALGSTETRLSQVDIGEELQRGQSAFNDQDYDQALQAWKPLAENGVAEAQYGLGFMYESGWGVEQNYVKAFKWYERAAKLGHTKSQYNLGLLYLNGYGVDKDLSKARHWIEIAASQKDARALDLIEKGIIQERQ